MKFDRNYSIITIACILTYAIYLLFEYYFTNGMLGAPLDDTWIHFRFAENFAAGNFFQFNIGEPTSGTTSPLWVVVLALFSFISNNYIFNSVFASALFHLASCLLIYRLALKIFSKKEFDFSNPPFLALIVSLLTVFAGRIAWAGLSGMETTMFTFFCIAGIYTHIINLERNKYTFVPALMFALATVSRPEGFLLFSLYIFDLVLNQLKNKEFKRLIGKNILYILLFAVITTPYLIFSYYTSGHFFPNTFRGQGGHLSHLPDLNYIRIIFVFFFRDNPIVAVLYLTAIVFYLSRLKKYFTKLKYLNLTFLWIILLPFVSSVLIPNWRHHARYMIPLIPLINLVAVFTFIYLGRKIKFERLRVFASRKLALICIVIFSLLYYGVYAIALGKNTDNINSQQVKIARWVQQNVPRDDTIALNDIGAITFLSGNRIIDMAGLVTPEILKYRTYQWDDNMDSTYLLLKNNNVSYVIIYDHWFQGFLDRFRDQFELVYTAILVENTICGGDQMKVYKTHFKEDFNLEETHTGKD